MRFVKRVNERGVITLPAELREALGVDDGDIIEFEVLNVVKKKGEGSPLQRFSAQVGNDDSHDDTPNATGGLA